MALFGNNKKKAVKAPKAQAPKATIADTAGVLEGKLTGPWFSEKALIGTEKGVYVFSIPMHSTKKDVAAAIEKMYKVTPTQVRIANLPAKKKALRTRRGVGSRARRRKAYVYLKKGDTITFA
ncbi:MAG: ribosomal protein L23 [Parcubacteria bacterium C7867-001]|nr:MAG: ribosomal protein L23 [Parcubacteria bacterium C7867-001]